MASRTRIEVGDKAIDDPGPDPFDRAADFIFFLHQNNLALYLQILHQNVYFTVKK